MGFTYREPFTIDHTKVVNSDQTQFPVVVAGTFSWAADIAHGGRAVNGNNGFDIRPFSDTGLTAALAFQLISWNGTTGALVMIVKRDIATATDTLIHFGVGDATLTTDGSSTAVWKSTIVASYMGSVTDRTANGYDLTAVGTPTTTAGLIGTARVYNGTTQYDWRNGLSMPVTAVPFAITALFRQATLGNGDVAGITLSSAGTYANCLSMLATGAMRALCIGANASTATGLISANVWSYGAARWVGASDRSIHANNNAATQATTTTTGSGTPDSISIGSRAVNSTHNNFLAIDVNVVRIYNADPGADWIATEYNSLVGFATFGSFGSEVSVGGAATSSPFFSGRTPRFITPRRRLI